jgi:hypothetical protein
MQNEEAAPRLMSDDEALQYCVSVLGWKHACIPSPEVREKFGLNDQIVHEYEPQDFWDTPQRFFYRRQPGP